MIEEICSPDQSHRRNRRTLPRFAPVSGSVLRELLIRATAPPAPARRWTLHHRQVAARTASAAAIRHERLHAEYDSRDAAAATGEGWAAGAAAARAAVRRGGLGAAAHGGAGWPEVAQPGAGLPARY
ncbi:hypothetical protein [Krasilnikovia sp. MM14-A1259]|uniref:hypothetical protein n=1 Tax=Krasilnikovia sp. MM14-A1259 TaxID=3373539 RepID=UPI00381B0BF4